MSELEGLVARGNDALARSAWAEARAAFEEALAETESAEAWEGLSWAAWWLDDGDATIRAREAAYRLHRQAGDDADAARMAMWLATDHEDFRGDLAIGRGWRQRARRILDDLPVCAEHGWFAVIEADVALVLEEDPVAARRCAAEAAAAARRCEGSGDIAILALAIEGLARVGEGEIDHGMSLLDEAAAAVMGGELQDEVWAIKILCYLIFACERVRDFDRATQWCDRLRELADRIQLTLAQGVCRAHYGSVLMSRGKWDEAEDQLGRSAEQLEASRPPWVGEALVRLAELRRRQGRPEEAAGLLKQAEGHPVALLGLAEIALDAGRLADAGELVERFLRHVPEANRLQRAAALELSVRVATLAGRRGEAAEALAGLQAISEHARTLPLRGAASFSAGLMAAAEGDRERARTCLEDAVDLFERGRTPYEAARARLELAGVLASLARPERARTEADAARATFEALGASFSAARAAALLASIDGRASPADAAAADSPLTGRQAEILRLVSRGSSDREIAAALGLSEHTVHRHVANILMRLDMPTRAAAAAHAAANGLI